MRLLRTVVAVALIAAVSGVAPLLADSAGRVSGYALDAGGRPLSGRRVELVELVRAMQGQAVGVSVQANVTDARGAWSFSSVPFGEYVVRMVYRDRTAGVRVSVTEASGVLGVLIVEPSLPLLEGLSQGRVAPADAGTGGVTTFAVAAATAVAAAVAAAAAVVVVARDES